MTPSRTRRLLFLFVPILLVAGMAWWWWRPASTMVQVATVAEGPLIVSVDETGTTRVRAHADVSAPVGGRWVPDMLRAGDGVPSGKRLGMLFPAPLDANAREQADARVGVTEAAIREIEARQVATRLALDEARRTRQRVESLGAVGAVPPQEVERARDAVVEQEANMAAFEERLRAARHERQVALSVLSGARGVGTGVPIVAPLGGTILRVHEEHERVVPAGTPLVEVGDPRDLEVVVPLLTADAMRVQAGAPVRLTFGEGVAASARETPSDTVRGTVKHVEPAAYTRLSALGVEEQRVDVIVVVPASAAHVGDRFRADARITVWESARVLRVPVHALVRDGEQWGAWVLRGGRVRRVSVDPGERNSEYAAVRRGLEPGDSVVLFPDERLAEGRRVRPGR